MILPLLIGVLSSYLDFLPMKTTDLAHVYLNRWVKPGDTVVDATCGNGQDTLFLARLLNGLGVLVSYDIQLDAIERTTALLEKELSLEQKKIVVLRHSSHEFFFEKKANAFVYNLGYLPKGNKDVTTLTSSTLKSLENACQLLSPGGIICVTTYSGHAEGECEEKGVLSFAQHLPATHWSVLHHRWLNRQKAPSLLLIQKAAST